MLVMRVLTPSCKRSLNSGRQPLHAGTHSLLLVHKHSTILTSALVSFLQIYIYGKAIWIPEQAAKPLVYSSNVSFQKANFKQTIEIERNVN